MVAKYMKYVIITALVLGAFLFAYKKYDNVRQEQERLQQDQLRIKELLEQQKKAQD